MNYFVNNYLRSQDLSLQLILSSESISRKSNRDTFVNVLAGDCITMPLEGANEENDRAEDRSDISSSTLSNGNVIALTQQSILSTNNVLFVSKNLL